ncbi:MAG: hypothetical protein ACI837_000070 [Crocinitomicaceae bacterium]
MKYQLVGLLCLVTCICGSKNLVAQSDFYAIDNIPEIRLYFVESNWDELLDSLYILGDQQRLAGNVTIDNSFYSNVGVRYKGFSSYSSSRDKNPLNIDLDYLGNEQNHLGHAKIKLSNVIQDPSFVREVLSYEIARKYMPASEANYANVYINDTLIGLYTSVEAVNKDFLQNHFGSRDNSFFKGNPESLDLNGENSNLSDSPGTEIGEYFPFYKLKSNDEQDWYDLQELIDTLNNGPENIAELLNVDQSLWMHAFNYTVINFDSYIGYAQNYYLAMDNQGRFNSLLWDMNMSFASYRLTDASDHWDGFTIEEAKYIDPLQHLNSFSVQPRPLIRNLLINDTYKRMYLAHIRTIVEENFTNQDYLSRALYFQSIIDSSVMADTNKFYSYADFTNNITATVSDLVDYPGITELMDDRAAYLLAAPGNQNVPVISAVTETPNDAASGETVWITAYVTGSPSDVFLAYRFAHDALFTVLDMKDDGLHGDGGGADNIYGVDITAISNLVEYYIYAENDSAGRFSPERAAHEFYTIKSNVKPLDLVINEVMANNEFTQSDPVGEFDDWIEFYNTTDYAISTGGMFFSNDANDLLKWAMPDVNVEPGAYTIVWADGDMSQFGVHAPFELSSEGESLWLSYADGTIIDSVIFGEQLAISSTGRYPNGTGDFIEMRPSYRLENTGADEEFITETLFVYPNPASDEVYLRFNNSSIAHMTMASLDGRTVMPEVTINGEVLTTVNTADLAGGVYIIRVDFEDTRLTKKILITH